MARSYLSNSSISGELFHVVNLGTLRKDFYHRCDVANYMVLWMPEICIIK
jgi:hypothetical protein